MNILITYGIIFVILLVLELAYLKVADKFNIVDMPNDRSSHSTIVLRGGGIVFVLGLWIWAAFTAAGWIGADSGFHYPWFLLAVTFIASVSFVDDNRSLPDSIRLVAQFIAMALMFYQLDFLHLHMWWIVIPALIVGVGASNVINFMDGLNGLTGATTMATLVPLYLLNTFPALSAGSGFIDSSLIAIMVLADVVFCLFNFRPMDKAKCFAGDVGSIGMAYILLFMIGSLVLRTGDVTYLIFLLVDGVDGVLTIGHRILLRENLGEAHRKHAFQIMANELKIGHVKVSLLYMTVQLAVSLGFIFLCPNTPAAHWIYLLSALLILTVAYVLFKRKYYHLHEAYLASIAHKHSEPSNDAPQ